MKKIYFVLLFLLININNVIAGNSADYLAKVGDDFNRECYEYYTKIDNLEKGVSYKIHSNKAIKEITQNGFFINFKEYGKKTGENINYSSDILNNNEISYLTDNNPKTTYEINTNKKNTIIIELDKEINSKEFYFNFDYISKYHIAEIYVSDESNIDKFFLVDNETIGEFNIKKLKIIFEKIKQNTPNEKIKIQELSFKVINTNYIIKPEFNDSIYFYTEDKCKSHYYTKNNSNKINYNINNDTKIINIEFEPNPSFNLYGAKDSDNDSIFDTDDNCPNTYNPKQNDINGDGKGDLCSDDDNDGIIGESDNCLNIYNPTQTDININGVGDKCEFDKDKDGIFDQLDNCINKYNPDQSDKDKDNIGDECDNCVYYNPRQLDINNNGIGDICEEKDQLLEENDNDKDGIIDFSDNCKKIANPDQLDSDNDGVGDMCDNCKNIQNKDQLDYNKNGVGDICEDSDNDGIDGLIDNCINIYNPDQLDSDNDNIGDKCEDDDGDKILAINDNCPYIYNPNQNDVDKDGLGDKCDKKDDRYIESNSVFFIGLLIFIVLIFGTGIFVMIRKMK